MQMYLERKLASSSANHFRYSRYFYSVIWYFTSGDELLYITGKPYDTLEEIVGVRGKGVGSFKEYNIGYNAVPLTEEGFVDLGAVAAAIHSNTKMMGIQRSKGYATRPSLLFLKLKK